MLKIVVGVLFLLLELSASPAVEAQDKPSVPAEQYQALRKEQNQLPDEFAKAKTAEERTNLRERLNRLPLKFLELAEKYPKDPVAVEALIQVVALIHASAFPNVGQDTPGDKALTLLVRDHVKSDKLGSACQHVAFGFHTSRETFLRSVLEQNPHREIQGLACLSLAQFLNDRVNRLDLLKDQEKPDMAEQYHRAFGKDFVEQSQRQDRAKVVNEIETLFDRASRQYADVKIPATYFGCGDTVGEKAGAQLFQVRHLSVGKEAPDIEGEDQEGKRFKLSDYRNKVVLLDFWYRG